MLPRHCSSFLSTIATTLPWPLAVFVSRWGEGLPSRTQLTVDSFLWQEKEKEKDKTKEKEKESKEKEKDKKTLNGHTFSPIPIVGPINCSQCMKPFTNKDAYTCASKRHASSSHPMRLPCLTKAGLFLVSCASHPWSLPHLCGEVTLWGGVCGSVCLCFQILIM